MKANRPLFLTALVPLLVLAASTVATKVTPQEDKCVKDLRMLFAVLTLLKEGD
jgi:hypothetical protein